MKVDVRWAANAAAKADRAVNRKDRLLISILHDELWGTLAVPEEKENSADAKPDGASAASVTATF